MVNRVANLTIRDGDMGMEVHLPDAEIRRIIDAPTRGLTHRQLLPLYPRTRNPGARYYESTIRFDMPKTQRSEIDIRIPPIRAASCSPLLQGRRSRIGRENLSGITSHLNSRVKVVCDQTNARQGSAGQNGDQKAKWDPQSCVPVESVKQELLAVMEKVKSASVFFADSGTVHAVVAKEDGPPVPSRKKYNSPGSGGEKMTRNQSDEAMTRRLQDYRDRPEEFRSFKKEVKEMLNTSMEGTSNKIVRNIGLIRSFTPSGLASTADLRRRKSVQKKQALQTFKADKASKYDTMCKQIESKHAANRRRADKAIADRFVAATKQKREMFEQMWTKNSILGSRMGVMLQTLLKERPVRERLKIDSAAAIRIQRWYRPKYWKRKSKKIQRGFRKLKVVIREFHASWKVKRLYRAADIILKALTEMQSQNQSATACKSFCRKVRKAQRAWRKYVNWRDFVLDTRIEHFKTKQARVGPDWEKKKVQIEAALAKATSNDDPDKIMGGFDLSAPPPTVPDAMIMQLVRESFRNDQQQFQVNMQTYREEYDTYRLKFGMWQTLEDAKNLMKSAAEKKKKKKDDSGEPPPARPERPVIMPKLSEEANWRLIKEGQKRISKK